LERAPSVRLCQFDHVVVKVEIARRSSPGLGLGCVYDAGARRHGAGVGRVQVRHPERNLCTTGDRAVLCRVESEVHEGAIGPRCGGVAAARPPVVAPVIADVEFEPEPVSIQGDGAVEIRCREHDRCQPILAVGHGHILAHNAGGGPDRHGGVMMTP
jgi:hypothetical protein